MATRRGLAYAAAAAAALLLVLANVASVLGPGQPRCEIVCAAGTASVCGHWERAWTGCSLVTCSADDRGKCPKRLAYARDAQACVTAPRMLLCCCYYARYRYYCCCCLQTVGIPVLLPRILLLLLLLLLRPPDSNAAC